MAKSDTGVRSRNLFDPTSPKPYKLSRSKLELFRECPRCFYLDRRIGVNRPETPAYTLNNAVDALLKREFDTYRRQSQPHPLITHAGLDAIPYQHESLETWRHNFTGVQYLHEPTNLLVHGAVDDVWTNKSQELIVVDYKATSTQDEITPGYAFRESYRRQLEIYQWLFRRNGFSVSETAYLVFANGRKDRDSFDGRLEFSMTVVPCLGKDDWVEPTVRAASACLRADAAPTESAGCSYCLYRSAAQKHGV